MNGYDLWGLFLSAFASSTLFPGGSEVVIVLLAHDNSQDPLLLLGVATAGNSLGGMSSWLIGRFLPARPLERPKTRRAVERVQRWGSPVLLLSWLPVIGDPLCVAAGWLRIPWLACFVFIAIGKGFRYGMVLAVV